MRMQADFLTECADFLCHTEDWDVMFVQNHIPDGINHMVLADLESPDRGCREEAETFLLGTVRIISDMIQAIKRRCADDSTLICVVSDHGNVPCPKYVNTNSIMMREGWSLFNQDGETGDWSLDVARSSAVFEQWQSGFWINVRGREKHGFVEWGEEYEQLRTDIIRRFRDVRDPETGDDVFALVGRREDFQSLGMWGERLPDVVGFVKPGYLFLLGIHNDVPEEMMRLYRQGDDIVLVERAHEAGIVWPIRAVHWHLPYANAGFTSNRAIFLLNGPGVTKGKRGERVNLVDVSATLAHVLDIDPPAQCEGRVIREAFLDS
jgi:predicted AlkP superfamily phosphohydrolase/phosphomutase